MKTIYIALAALIIIGLLAYKKAEAQKKTTPETASISGGNSSGANSGSSSGTASDPCGQPFLSRTDFEKLNSQKILKAGSSGCEVKYLQQRLNMDGANPRLAVDGQFGPATKAALMSEVAEAKSSIETVRQQSGDQSKFYSEYMALNAIQSGGEITIYTYNQIIADNG